MFSLIAFFFGSPPGGGRAAAHLALKRGKPNSDGTGAGLGGTGRAGALIKTWLAHFLLRYVA